MLDKQEVLEAIVKAPQPVSVRELSRELDVRGSARGYLRKALRTLERQGKIREVWPKHYGPTKKASQKLEVVSGRLSVTSRGFGFVAPDFDNWQGPAPFEDDVFIPPDGMMDALDGDLVKAKVTSITGRGGKGPSGYVVEVVQHAHDTVVGRYETTGKNRGRVFPRNTKIGREVRVSQPPKELGVKDQDWVEVTITEFTPDPQPLIGKVTNRLGGDEDRGIDVLLVLRDLGIEEEFPKSVEQAAKKLEFDWEADLKGRQDLRQMKTVTIDPTTAKDYDDAITVEEDDEGFWLWVHIADVSHFIKTDSPLDREALDRSTSVYPVDRVVPMLPERISNYLCSLVPHEDRLTMTAKIRFDKQGKMQKYEVFSSAIHSDHRMTYEQLQKIFDEEDEAEAGFEEALSMLKSARKLARLLRKNRFERGALDLDIPEVSVVFDERGKVFDLRFYPRYEAHQLVEEFMLAANEATARLLTEKEYPLLYRIHDVADPEKLESLEGLLGAFGIRLRPRGGEITPKSIQKAIEQAQKKEAGHILRKLILRAMKRAEYAPENVGHFGLASEYYCHFTSPIRRYPDVIVHRQLKALEKGRTPYYNDEDNDLDELGEHTSARERRAQEAEWEATEIKALEFMQRFQGEVFSAYIASVTNWGLYVQIERYPVEGLVPVNQLKGDYYEVDELRVALVGKNTGHQYRLGDKVFVQIVSVNPLAQEMNLVITNEEGEEIRPETEPKRFRGRKKGGGERSGKPRQGRRKGGKRGGKG